MRVLKNPEQSGGIELFRIGFGKRDGASDKQSMSTVPMRDLPSRDSFRAVKSSGELPWTSTLSVGEWLSLRKLTLQPLGQAMGSSVYRMGWIRSPVGVYGWGRSSAEIREPTQALYDARQLALGRMREEAVRLGANAVVDAKLIHKGFESLDDCVEFVCIGTAVRVEGISPAASPIICSTTGEDLLRLLAAGSFPVGLAIGASYYYLATSNSDRWQQTSFFNQEMKHFTNGVYSVRHFAERRLREDAARLGADGVVGVDFTFRVEEVEANVSQGSDQEVEDHILEYVLFGTAISREKRDQNPLGAGIVAFDLRD